MEEEYINVCCPFLDIADCEDTDEHSHLYCTTNGDFMNLGMAHQYCVSEDWEKCPHFMAYPIQIPFTD